MRPSFFADTLALQIPLGYLRFVILYRKNSKNSRGEWLLFAKFAEESHVIPDVRTLLNPQRFMNAPRATGKSELGKLSTNWMDFRTAKSALSIRGRRLR
jgi:hypothetical protein